MAKKSKKEAEVPAQEQLSEVIVETRTTDKNGNALLPTMEDEVLVIPELRDAIKENKLTLVPAFQAAQKALSVSRAHIEELGQKHKNSLLLDEERGVRTYDDGEVHFEIAEKDSVSFSVVKDSE